MRYYEVDFHIQLGTEGHTDTDAPGADMLFQSVRDVIAASAGEAGFETFEDTADGIRGYVQTAMFDREALEQALEYLPFENTSITFDVREAENKNWNEAWENEGFEPIAIDRRCVIHDGRHVPADNSFGISVEIDARMAFGTGTHETTRMVVAALLDMNLEGKSILDCGCGTGILGIVALKRGAGSATGYDIDEWSADNARHNAVINGVDEHYTPLLGDASVLQNMDEKFDIVVANINRNILLEDMPRFRKVMKNGALLILSGFYKEDIPMLEAKAACLGLKSTATREDNGWACMVLRQTD